jgi:hypothetical protein
MARRSEYYTECITLRGNVPKHAFRLPHAHVNGFPIREEISGALWPPEAHRNRDHIPVLPARARAN